MDSERWSAALWPFVRDGLPSPPATVLELGCGPAGGFVPALRQAGYDATGIDPRAPEAQGYHRVPFEQHVPAAPVDALVAGRSLHHVGDLAEVVERMAAALAPGGVVIVAEWAWERFDDSTAHWCFERLGDAGDDERPWLPRRRDAWLESGEPWDAYFQAWAAGHGLHRGERILDALGTRFDTVSCHHGPYFFPDLGIGEEVEQAGIDAGEVAATGIRYVGTLRAT